jgi:hypothetical protein
MYKTSLVRELIEDGDKLLRELDRQRFPVTAALWYYEPDHMSWKLVIASEVAQSPGPREAYLRVQQAIRGVRGLTFALDDILVMGPQTRKFQDLRRTIEGVSQMAAPEHRGELEGALFEDAYIYRWPN